MSDGNPHPQNGPYAGGPNNGPGGPYGGQQGPMGPASQPTPPSPGPQYSSGQGQYQGQQGYGPSAPQYGGGQQQPGYNAYAQTQPVPPKKKSMLPWILGGAALLVVIALIIGVLVFVAGRGGGNATPSPGQPHRTPAGSVQAYFDALMGGDAEGALRLAYQEPADKTFLTNEVLSAALTDSPITELQINAPTSTNSYSNPVHVTYRIGDREVSTVFETIKDGDVFKLMRVTQDVYLSSLNADEMDIQLNGVKLVGDKANLFPGTYTVTTDNKYFTIKPNTFRVESPTSSSVSSTSGMKAELNDTATKDIRTAAKSHLTSCLKAKKMVNPACGINFNQPSGTKAVESSLSCSVSSGETALDRASFRTSYSNNTEVTSYVSLRLRCTVKGENGRSYVGNASIIKVTADISQEPIKVTFD